MAKKGWDPIIEINKAVESAEKLESQHLEIKESKNIEPVNEPTKEKTCFWVFCW
jgi:hypothetical protein